MGILIFSKNLFRNVYGLITHYMKLFQTANKKVGLKFVIQNVTEKNEKI